MGRKGGRLVKIGLPEMQDTAGDEVGDAEQACQNESFDCSKDHVHG